MALPVPNLDDRRFQDLVDDAKRLVQQKCPEWTDHNVSDPGVTLIETFAWMTDQVLYRLNRVPDRNYVKFLELIGVRLFPPTAARAAITFWLAGPQTSTVHIKPGTQVATRRSDTDEAIAFTTIGDLPIVPSRLARLASTLGGEKEVRDHTEALEAKTSFYCFDKVPKPDDVLLIGLSEAVPSCAVTLRFQCDIEGVGVDPENPPLLWEAWDGYAWSACEVDRDGTGGLNRDGDVVLHVPKSHTVSVIQQQRAGWLRARVLKPEPDQPTYSASPTINGLTAFTIGGTTEAVNAELVENELLGASEGVPGQGFSLKHRPVVPGGAAAILEVSGVDGWQEWTQAQDFVDSKPDDHHFVLDAVAGEVQLGPGVREPDGVLRNYGAVPPKGARLRLRSYLIGGGGHGNVARNTISVLKSSIPYVSKVQNRRAAEGGVDGEDIENAKVRGPIVLRTRDRAVTMEDYEHLAREAAPEVARVRCVTAGDGADAGGVRILVVPAAGSSDGRLRFEQLVPNEETLQRISRRLDGSRVIGTRVLVEPPVYRGVTVVAKLRPRASANATRLQADALDALYHYFHPVSGGPDRTGWPFGRPVHVGEVYSVLQGLRGTELVEDARLFGADPVTGQRGQAVQRLVIEPNALVFSYEHQVLVEGA
ncbi:MAG: putative baseplate assembly protein [Chloroflexi bacterium]|nr:MAG: putative baseplate assembly protein [Chloroflexota bacterium]TMG20089.1 MAG: putative baseplate assembly protein [Chloroflexota bacterium]TMG45852.1 MAG: putative baseplate assembly protein [Chloroflexota bacterium]